MSAASMNADVRYDREEIAMTRMLLRPSEVAEVIACGKTKTYELIHRGLIGSVRIDGAIRVPARAVTAFCERLEAEAASPTLP